MDMTSILALLAGMGFSPDALIALGGGGAAALGFVLWLLGRGRKQEEKPTPIGEPKIPELPKKEEVLEEKIAQKVEPIPVTKSWFERLQNGLGKTKQRMSEGWGHIFEKNDAVDETVFEHLFQGLIQADVGVKTSEALLARLKDRQKNAHPAVIDAQHLQNLLAAEILALLREPHAVVHTAAKPHVTLMVGVNGAGKTTTVGKLAYKASKRGSKVFMGAGDTFRAAATEQLATWAERASAHLVALPSNADPASVAFETVKRAIAENADICFIDTAGRLQNRKDLMEELTKIRRVMAKAMPDAPHETFLILDATTGQNGLQQAKLFMEAVPLTGIIVTKLDGSARGGIVLAIAHELKIPIRYVGVGESVDDLEPFDAEQFVQALTSKA